MSDFHLRNRQNCFSEDMFWRRDQNDEGVWTMDIPLVSRYVSFVSHISSVPLFSNMHHDCSDVFLAGEIAHNLRMTFASRPIPVMIFSSVELEKLSRMVFVPPPSI